MKITIEFKGDFDQIIKDCAEHYRNDRRVQREIRRQQRRERLEKMGVKSQEKDEENEPVLSDVDFVVKHIKDSMLSIHKVVSAKRISKEIESKEA